MQQFLPASLPNGIPFLLGLLALVPTGCSFGPKMLLQTHGKYSQAVQRVDEEEFLQNIVLLRYTEAPRNLDVAAIAAQYELDANAEARPFFSTEATGNLFRSFRSLLPFGGVGMANRPTVSLTPHNDGTTVRQFMTPISAETLLFLTQSGWPAGIILRIWVDRLNGVPNGVPAGGPTREAASDYDRFRRACDLIQVAQDRELLSIVVVDRVQPAGGPLPADAITAGAVVEAARAGLEYRPQADGKLWELVKREKGLLLQVNPVGRNSEEVNELCRLLNLVPGRENYEVVVGSGMVPDPQKNPTEPSTVLRVTPRSTAQAMFFLANGVCVPNEHVEKGLVRMPPGICPTQATEGFFRIRQVPGHCFRRPSEAHVAVHYRDHWFYIDERDHDSKATFFLMLELSRLDFLRQRIGGLPMLTLPVGR